MLDEKQKKALEIENRKIENNLDKIKYRIVVFSGKGGVGKTTVSVNLAYALSLLKYNTGILDADVTGPNIPKMLGLGGVIITENDCLIPQEKNGVKVISIAYIISPDQPIIWRGPMRSKLLNQFLGDVQWGQLDYLIADLPPGTGDEILTMTQKMKPDMAIIVTTPQEVSLIDSARAINMAKKMEIPKICLIENMSILKCPICGNTIDLFSTGGGKNQAKNMNITYLGALPVNLEARKLADQGIPIILKDSEADISLAIFNIVTKIEALYNSYKNISTSIKSEM